MFYQIQHFGISEYFCKEYGKNFNFPTHLHQSFEFIVVLSGEMHVAVDNNLYKLKEWDSVLIFPHQLHSLSSNNSEHMLCIFSPEIVKSYASKILNKKPDQNVVTLNKYLINALDNLSEESSTFEKKGILYSICAEFDKNAEYVQKPSFDENILQNIFLFIEKNYCTDCELHSIADDTGYSYSYLSRYFKKITGISFNSYKNRYRINNACYLLANSNYSILQCALESGYQSLRSFNRNFKNILGITPIEYRNRLKVQLKEEF
ncbi:MAG: AraC family transcriptional regulator [Clostridia bacterium]|nr:AraC family transcriptional regulator [Clostridia bacterium]